MWSRRLQHAIPLRSPSTCLFCITRSLAPHLQTRPFAATTSRSKAKSSHPTDVVLDDVNPNPPETEHAHAASEKVSGDGDASPTSEASADKSRKGKKSTKVVSESQTPAKGDEGTSSTRTRRRARRVTKSQDTIAKTSRPRKTSSRTDDSRASKPEAPSEKLKGISLKDALLQTSSRKKGQKMRQNLPIEILAPDELDFHPVEHDIPPIPMLSHGLDRVLFNRGVYRLQDPRSRVYNFDPYLEKIMPVAEFDFDALSEYKTSSKDEDLLAMTRRLGTRFTGSTSSMSSALMHFHFLLSGFRELNHEMLSRTFPNPSSKFSKITHGPSAIFLRYKDGLYAIDADKSFDEPNIMSWLGHSLEKLLTSSRDEMERYRRSSLESAPHEDESGRCFHYSRLGNFLMRSQLDAHDKRLPGSGVFDLKTRAVVSIRMNHTEYETGTGYQIKYDQGEWESFEREFYDMTRATMLKYSLQVRMGRMDGIFVAYHNIERIFGFQYLSLPDMDQVLHGQTDTCLGDQEFKLSIRLLDELLQRATAHFPETSLRLHFESRNTSVPYMYVFAEPVTEEQADEIQNGKNDLRKEFERDVIGVKRDDPEVQAEWHDIQERVDEEVEGDELQSREERDLEVADEVETVELQPTSTSEETGEQSEATGEGSERLEEASDATPSTSSKPEPEPKPSGPLKGWTLTIRNRVNGRYVDRPEDLLPKDTWNLEYHIQDIDPGVCWNLYETTKRRRDNLIGESAKERSNAVQYYQDIIKRYSNRGRRWRAQQDQLDQQLGTRVYRPLGPGAEDVVRLMAGEGLVEDVTADFNKTNKVTESEDSAEDKPEGLSS